MKKIRLVWSTRAKHDLKGIKGYISRDAPRTARKFVKQLKEFAKKLESFPELGQILEETDYPGHREIVYGNYRIIYQSSENEIVVLTVMHGARLLRGNALETDGE